MQIKTMRVIIVMIFLGCALFEEAYAQLVKHIRIENSLDPASISGTYTQAGSWSILHSGGTSYTCPSDNTKNYSIAGTPTFDSLDQDSDLVRFHNATITALTDVCGHISFWAKFTPDPSGLVDFDLSSIGQIKHKNGSTLSTSGSWVHLTAWFQHYVNGATPGEADGVTGIWEHIGTTAGPPNYPPVHDKHGSAVGAASFNLATDENPDLPNIVNNRLMKGELWFFLKKDHQLILNSGTGVTVTTAAGGGGGGDGVNEFVLETMAERTKEIEDRMKEIEEQFIRRFLRIERELKLKPEPPSPVPPTPGP